MANETTENELNQTGEPGTEYFMETLSRSGPLRSSSRRDPVAGRRFRRRIRTGHQHVGRRMANPAPQPAVHHLRLADPVHHRGGHRPRSVHQAGSERLRSGQLLDAPASAGPPLRLRLQGCDVYTRVVYGTRTSLSVGVLSTLLVVIVGTLIGAVAGFFGGWVDAVLSRITDIFFALPMLLGAIVVLQMFKTSKSIWKIVLVLTLFGWVGVCRIARSAVLESKNLEFNTASTALGSTPARNLFRHILPNSLAPIIVIATTSLASYIVAEATLSFLGVGLPTTTVSWGGDISSAQTNLQTDPMVLFLPVRRTGHHRACVHHDGHAVKAALDPKSRTA